MVGFLAAKLALGVAVGAGTARASPAQGQALIGAVAAVFGVQLAALVWFRPFLVAPVAEPGRSGS